MITCNAQQQCDVVMIIVNGVLIEVIIRVKDVAALSHRCDAALSHCVPDVS